MKVPFLGNIESDYRVGQKDVEITLILVTYLCILKDGLVIVFLSECVVVGPWSAYTSVSQPADDVVFFCSFWRRTLSGGVWRTAKRIATTC